MTKMETLEVDISTRAYKTLLDKARDLGFKSRADLVRHALANYLEGNCESGC